MQNITMFVKFATTAGDVYQNVDEPPLNIGEKQIGQVITTDEGIFIVDRYPSQETSQLKITNIIRLLRYLLQKMYQLESKDVQIYLPKLDANINNQALHQAQFQTLNVSIPAYNNNGYLKQKTSNTTNNNNNNNNNSDYFNITLLYV